MATSQQSNLDQIQQAVATAKSLCANGVTPATALQVLASQNPTYNDINNLVQQNGGDMQAAAMQLAQRRGIALDPLISMYQSLNKQ